MIQLDEQLLLEVGLKALPADSRNEVLGVMYTAMEYGVGCRLAALMNTEQLDRFEAAMAAGDDDRCLELLREAIPDYPQLVVAEAVIAKRWLAAHARAVLAVCWQSPPDLDKADREGGS